MSNKNTRKKVTVVIPNYNYMNYIRKRIDSVMKQTYPVYEIIVLDDGSTDGSAELAKGIVLDLKLGRPDLNIRFIANEKNSGSVISQWRRGFKEAKGDYVWVAEADDVCSRRFLEEVMKRFEDDDVVMAYSESRVINGAGVIIAPNFRWSRDKEKTGHYKTSYTKDGKQEIAEIMAVRCSIPNVSAVVFKKDKKIPFEKYLSEAAGFSQVGDWFFYTKVLEHGKISYVKKSLNHFRIHRQSVTSGAKRGQKHFEEVKEMHDWLLKKYKISDVVKKRMQAEEKRMAARIGKE